jgi:hypothetical protein
VQGRFDAQGVSFANADAAGAALTTFDGYGQLAK